MGIPEETRQSAGLTESVAGGLETEKVAARSLRPDDLKSGEWLLALLQKVIRAYDRNARAEYFQRKYPGLHPDEIADILTSVTVRYAAISGALTGAVVTADMIATWSSAGMTLALMNGAIGAEMLYLARIQMRLVLDLSVVYDLQLDPKDPEDMLLIFGYALGIAPADVLGKWLVKVTGGGTEYVIEKYVSRGTIEVIRDYSRRVGVRILQRTIIKYMVPIASAIVGSSYNYVSTKSVGRIARSHLKNRGRVTDELRLLVSRQNTYDIAFPAAAMYMAQVDGRYSAKEKEFYRALLSRMSFNEYAEAEFRKLLRNEDDLLAAIAEFEGEEVRNSLLEVLVLMAIYDGELAEQESEFLTATATVLGVPLDLDEVEKRTRDYQVALEMSVFRRTAVAASGTASRMVDVAEQTVEGLRGTVAVAGSKSTDAFVRAFGREEAGENGVVCENCGNKIRPDLWICPACGHLMGSGRS